MLFMAVFAGFLAESYLDYKTERHKEHDYLTSLVSDLKIDTTDIAFKVVNMEDFINNGYHLSEYFYQEGWMNKYTDSIYILSEKMHTAETTLQYADGTIDQLKNAGGFRLIKNYEITEKIKEYTKDQDRIKDHEQALNLRYAELIKERSNIIYNNVFTYDGVLLDGKIKIGLRKERLDSIYKKTGAKFLTNNQSDFIKFSNSTSTLIGSMYVYKEMAKLQKIKATELIQLIQNDIK
jgi:hypothetical protein